MGLIVILVASCATSEPQTGEIDALTSEIQGLEPAEVRAAIVRRFGSPARDIGSGLSIEQWDVAGGVLTFHPLTGPTFAKDEVSTRLIRTTNPAGDCLVGSYEMTTLPDPANHGNCFWLGNVALNSEGRYRFTGGPNGSPRPGQEDNYFMRHPEGTARVEYAAGVTPRTRLEDLADSTRVATVTFACDGGGSMSYMIVAHGSSMRLAFEGSEPLSFRMNKGWVSYWR
jgi:hypothetical protein